MEATTAAVETVKKIFDDLNRGDFSRIADYFAEDVIITAPAGRLYKGRDAVLEQARQIATELSDSSIKIVDILPGETKVGVAYVLTGTNASTFDLGPIFGKVSPRGKPMTIPGFWLLTFKDGKITSLVEYSDFYTILAQLALFPPAPALVPV